VDEAIRARAMKIREFNRFYTNIIGLVNQTILESPYSLAEARVLRELDSAGTCTATDLTRLLNIDPGYLSRMLRRFKKEKLLAAARSPADGRAQVLSLTAKGKEIFAALSEASTNQLAGILERLPAREQQKLVDCMETIRAILSGQREAAPAIRPYRTGEAGYIAWRHGVLYEKEYGLDRVFEKYVLASLVKFLDSEMPGNIWIAECNGDIAGFIGIAGVDEATAQLRWFLIEPEFRGLGLGRQLMAVAMDYCREMKYKKVFLWTFQELAAARHLYKCFGFTLVEEKPNNTWKRGLIEEKWQAAV